MKIELEHSDICKALAHYLRTKNFAVDADPRNFVFKEEEAGELLVVVKNGDMITNAPPLTPESLRAAVVPPVNPARPPVPPAKPHPAARVSPKARIFAKNDPFEPVPPPREQVPAPRLKVLDPQAARSPALHSAPAHPGMPAPREVIQNFGAEKKGEELVEEPAQPVVAPTTPSGLIIDPAAMSEDDQRLFQDILSRSAAATESAVAVPAEVPARGADIDMMGAEEFVE
jgi:hypothetical protein